MDELRRVQRDYAAAFAQVLALAKQRGLDCPTVERRLHAMTLDDDSGTDDADHMQAALQKAAQAFREVVDAVHKAGFMTVAAALSLSAIHP